MLSLSPSVTGSPPSCAFSWYKRRIRENRCCIRGPLQYWQFVSAHSGGSRTRFAGSCAMRSAISRIGVNACGHVFAGVTGTVGSKGGPGYMYSCGGQGVCGFGGNGVLMLGGVTRFSLMNSLAARNDVNALCTGLLKPWT